MRPISEISILAIISSASRAAKQRRISTKVMIRPLIRQTQMILDRLPVLLGQLLPMDELPRVYGEGF